MAETKGERSQDAPQERRSQQQDGERRNALEEAGATFGEDREGVRRLTSAPDDDDPVDAAALTPAGVTNAPQNYDDVTATFSAGKLDPHADNVDDLNDAQSRATVGHAVEPGGAGIGPASGSAAGRDAVEVREERDRLRREGLETRTARARRVR